MVDIALECQYQSQSALTRSFKRATGLTPGEYRRTWRTTGSLSGLGQAQASDQTGGGVTMKPRLVEKDKMLVVGMVYYGENKKGEIGRLWGRFTPKSTAIRNVFDRRLTYGVCFNDDHSLDPNFCYLACLEVTDLEDIPADMVGKTLPANTYAVFTHHGSLGGGSEKLAATYRHIYGTWLPGSGYELATSYDFEAYDEDFDPERESSKMDIYIPVKRRV